MNYEQFLNISGYGQIEPKLMIGFILLAVWSLIWKGIALWKSAKNDSRNWFIALLIFNTVGILEIIYIFFFAKKQQKVQ